MRNAEGRLIRVLEAHRVFSEEKLRQLYDEFGPYWLENLAFESGTESRTLSVGGRVMPGNTDASDDPKRFQHTYAYVSSESPSTDFGSVLIGEFGVALFVRRAPDLEPEFLRRVELQDEAGKTLDVIDSGRVDIRGGIVERRR